MTFIPGIYIASLSPPIKSNLRNPIQWHLLPQFEAVQDIVVYLLHAGHNKYKY
jgi:hypothetical protein